MYDAIGRFRGISTGNGAWGESMVNCYPYNDIYSSVIPAEAGIQPETALR
jgi:hypothetical protein